MRRVGGRRSQEEEGRGGSIKQEGGEMREMLEGEGTTILEKEEGSREQDKEGF